ncbi:hypothetical protein HDU67_010298 [Dinochytrium kinnereticum]|nr:hypothetical protein HDU67_010298 [Dinochytrium kinnereticum]
MKFMNVGSSSYGLVGKRAEAEKNRVDETWPPLHGFAWTHAERKDEIGGRLMFFQASSEGSIFCQEYRVDDGTDDIGIEPESSECDRGTQNGHVVERREGGHMLSFEDKYLERLESDPDTIIPKEVVDDVLRTPNLLRPWKFVDAAPMVKYIRYILMDHKRVLSKRTLGKRSRSEPDEGAKAFKTAIEFLKESLHPTLLDLYFSTSPRIVQYSEEHIPFRPILPHPHPLSWVLEAIPSILKEVETPSFSVMRPSQDTESDYPHTSSPMVNILAEAENFLELSADSQPEKFLWNIPIRLLDSEEAVETERATWIGEEDFKRFKNLLGRMFSSHVKAIDSDLDGEDDIGKARDYSLEWLARDLQLSRSVLRTKPIEVEAGLVRARFPNRRQLSVKASRVKRRKEAQAESESEMPSSPLSADASSEIWDSSFGDLSDVDDAASATTATWTESGRSSGDDFDTSSSWGGTQATSDTESHWDSSSNFSNTDDENASEDEEENDDENADTSSQVRRRRSGAFAAPLPLHVPAIIVAHPLLPNRRTKLSSRASRLRDRWLNPHIYYPSMHKHDASTAASQSELFPTQGDSQQWGNQSHIDLDAETKFRLIQEDRERERRESTLRVASSGRLSLGTPGSSHPASLDRRISMPTRLFGGMTEDTSFSSDVDSGLGAASQPAAWSGRSSFPVGSLQDFASQPAINVSGPPKPKKKRRAGF